MAGGRMAGLSLGSILLTYALCVNRPGSEITPRRTQNYPLGGFLSNAYALELTVAHKTVAEPH
jgi:hypothetical protein